MSKKSSAQNKEKSRKKEIQLLAELTHRLTGEQESKIRGYLEKFGIQVFFIVPTVVTSMLSCISLGKMTPRSAHIAAAATIIVADMPVLSLKKPPCGGFFLAEKESLCAVNFQIRSILYFVKAKANKYMKTVANRLAIKNEDF